MLTEGEKDFDIKQIRGLTKRRSKKKLKKVLLISYSQEIAEWRAEFRTESEKGGEGGHVKKTRMAGESF